MNGNPTTPTNNEQTKRNDKNNSPNLLESNLLHYQPSISDQIKVGFYSSDRFTQTHESDVINIKQAAENINFLCQYNLEFAKNSTQNQFDYELHNKSVEIYAKLNEKFAQLKKQEEDNLNRLRGAYKSQLANAIARLTKSFEEKHSSKLNKNVNKNNAESLKTNEYLLQIRELQRTIEENEKTINELKIKGSESETNNKLSLEYEQTIFDLREETEEVKGELTNARRKAERLEEALNIKEEETEKIMSELTNLQLQLHKQQILNDQLNKDFSELKAKNEQEKSKIKKDYEKQRISMESKMHEKVKETRENIVNAAKQELKQQQEFQKEQERQLLSQQQLQEEQSKQLLSQQLSQQKNILASEKMQRDREIEELKQQQKLHQAALFQEKLSMAEALKQEKEREALVASSKYSKKEDIDLIVKLKNSELFLRMEVARLSRELNRNNETWEKKFDILKHSLHAIKDEMYLRQNLQKQSAQLSYASVAYTMNQPPSLQQQFSQMNEPNRSHFSHDESKSTRTVLPTISAVKKLDRQFSFTVSVPSRLSNQLENEDAQIVGDEEMNQFKKEFLNDIDFIPAKLM